MIISTGSKEKLVERLAPILHHKIRPTIRHLKKYYAAYAIKEDYNSLVKAALWVAVSELTQKKMILKRAYSLVIGWIKEEVKTLSTEKWKVKNPNRAGPEQDYLTLPWGTKTEPHIKSGEVNTIEKAIEPTTTDFKVLKEDTANSLYEILKYIMEYWGPHSLVWFIMTILNNHSYINAMRQMKSAEEQIVPRYIRQGERAIKRIKEDIQSKFNSMEL